MDARSAAINHLFQQAQSRWLKSAEVLSILQNHDSSLILENPPQKPISGSVFLFNKKALSDFRRDGHNWKKHEHKNSVKETHMRLKVDNGEALTCYYAHGEDNSNFKRRSYWMLDQEKNHIVLVHYRDTTKKQDVDQTAVLGCDTNVQELDQAATSQQTETGTKDIGQASFRKRQQREDVNCSGVDYVYGFTKRQRTKAAKCSNAYNVILDEIHAQRTEYQVRKLYRIVCVVHNVKKFVLQLIIRSFRKQTGQSGHNPNIVDVLTNEEAFGSLADVFSMDDYDYDYNYDACLMPLEAPVNTPDYSELWSWE